MNVCGSGQLTAKINPNRLKAVVACSSITSNKTNRYNNIIIYKGRHILARST